MLTSILGEQGCGLDTRVEYESKKYKKIHKIENYIR